jgi:hypothetical protein
VEAPDLPADLDVFSNAVLLVDKPTDWTSFDACHVIKRAIKRIGISKVGQASESQSCQCRAPTMHMRFVATWRLISRSSRHITDEVWCLISM